MTNAKASTTEKSFSFETVAVLCCIILKNGGTIGGAQYDMMSALDGKRTASGFQHEFRAVLKRGKELKESTDKDGVPPPVTPKTTRVTKDKTSKTSAKKRAAPKVEEGEDDADAADRSSPSKRVKTEVEAFDELA